MVNWKWKKLILIIVTSFFHLKLYPLERTASIKTWTKYPIYSISATLRQIQWQDIWGTEYCLSLLRTIPIMRFKKKYIWKVQEEHKFSIFKMIKSLVNRYCSWFMTYKKNDFLKLPVFHFRWIHNSLNKLKSLIALTLTTRAFRKCSYE